MKSICNSILILTVIVMFAHCIVKADDPPETIWGIQFSYFENFRLSADAAGNSYIVGTTSDSLSASYAGGLDALVIKINEEGEIQWLVNVGTEADDSGLSLSIDNKGNCFLAGETAGAFVDSSYGLNDAFLVKLDADGNVLWLRQYGTSTNDKANRIVIDNAGNCLVGGSTSGNLAGDNSGLKDFFLLKLNTSGEILWQTQYGTRSNDECEFIVVDKDDNCYALLSTKKIVRFRSTGELLDERSHTMYHSSIIAVDDSQNVYVGGYNGVNYGAKATLAKYSSTWEKQWEKSFGSGSWTGIHGMTMAANDIVVSGCQNWPNCFTFCRRYDPDGNLLWSYSIQETVSRNTCGQLVVLDGKGNYYITGFTNGNLFGTAVKDQEIYIAQLKKDEETSLETGQDLPDKFILLQNYPNPFNPSTKIVYSLNAPAHINLSVYNSLGQKVKTLCDGFAQSGEYSEIWEGRNENNLSVDSGVYFCRLQCGDFVSVKKIILLK